MSDEAPRADEGGESSCYAHLICPGCGIVLDGYADVKEEDVIEFFQTKQVEQTLE